MHEQTISAVILSAGGSLSVFCYFSLWLIVELCLTGRHKLTYQTTDVSIKNIYLPQQVFWHCINRKTTLFTTTEDRYQQVVLKSSQKATLNLSRSRNCLVLSDSHPNHSVVCYIVSSTLRYVAHMNHHDESAPPGVVSNNGDLHSWIIMTKLSSVAFLTQSDGHATDTTFKGVFNVIKCKAFILRHSN